MGADVMRRLDPDRQDARGVWPWLVLGMAGVAGDDPAFVERLERAVGLLP